MNPNYLNAYEVLKEEELQDIHSKGWLLRHKKTGARVMLIENSDENKVFNIAFRTPPKNSTGVAHILEHSVLCGSREFPLKDPFVELVKGSLNTFLNAMTYPDKTCYPVASCNDRDFQNLMHVYLDAVFYPNIYKKEEIFRQEGWNYHLEKKEGPLKYNGVVYNEMKGAFSSPDDVLEREIMNSLFPDTTYGCESGGDPVNIPDLSYEEFLDFHRQYYHPSNSFIYLYGNMDMEEKLEFLDSHYLSAFDSLVIDSEIRDQEAFAQVKDIQKSYPVSEDEGEEDNTYLSYNMVVGEAADINLSLAFEVLDYALLSAPGAPLKQALLDAKIGKDIYGSFEDGIKQTYFSIVAKGANLSRKEEFIKVIRDTLTKIAEDGIDKKAVTAGINYYEFRFREADFSSYPKGLMYGLDILSSWLYDDTKPFCEVQLLEGFEFLKKALEEGYFEELIRKYLLDNTHGAILSLVPEKGLAAKRDKELEEKLENYRKSLSDEELTRMVENTKALEAYQEAEEAPEALTCIPMLSREDIKKEITGLTNEEHHVEDSLFLYHDVCTNGIGYADLLFEIHDFDVDTVHYLGLLKSVLGAVDTENYTYGELFNEVNARTGGIAYGIEVFDDAQDTDAFRAMFAVRGKALYPEMDFMFSMIREVLTTSKLDDTKRLYEIIARVRSRAQASLASAGHSTAVLRGASYASPMAAFQDEMAGIGYYQFIEKLEKDFDSCKDEIVKNLRKVMEEVLRPENFCVSYTGERESLDVVKAQAAGIKKVLFNGQKPESVKQAPCIKKNEAFKTSGQVQYVAQNGNFRKKGLEYTGALEILKVILSYDYLWINLRVKGGAYGCMSGFKRNGESFLVSYRDPHLKRTLEVYQGVPDYIRAFEADEREMTKYIIGTISNKDVPRTPQMQGSISKTAYFSNVTEDMLQKERNQILGAQKEDIQKLAALVEAVLSDDQICVVGSETAIEKAEDVFMEVKPLIG
ncbi:insulinase family protein [Blautia massiliensis (ex Durand et al. 2017)]|uniref:insulinase family protein n=1 Tax=Blautia massiliensis (ex Durand et al. 2017) TaxID=1737424 RepID=UPI0024203BB3|nr:insulinase family protein [Blautia massiliensis (ex Durand et al. 2017)]